MKLTFFLTANCPTAKKARTRYIYPLPANLTRTANILFLRYVWKSVHSQVLQFPVWMFRFWYKNEKFETNFCVERAWRSNIESYVYISRYNGCINIYIYNLYINIYDIYKTAKNLYRLSLGLRLRETTKRNSVRAKSVKGQINRKTLITIQIWFGLIFLLYEIRDF